MSHSSSLYPISPTEGAVSCKNQAALLTTQIQTIWARSKAKDRLQFRQSRDLKSNKKSKLSRNIIESKPEKWTQIVICKSNIFGHSSIFRMKIFKSRKHLINYQKLEARAFFFIKSTQKALLSTGGGRVGPTWRPKSSKMAGWGGSVYKSPSWTPESLESWGCTWGCGKSDKLGRFRSLRSSFPAPTCTILPHPQVQPHDSRRM